MNVAEQTPGETRDSICEWPAVSFIFHCNFLKKRNDARQFEIDKSR